MFYSSLLKKLNKWVCLKKGEIILDIYVEFLGDNFGTMSLRIFTAAVLCGLVGIERELKKHPAGLRTHLLVGVGSCLMMLLSLYGFEPYIDQSSNIRFDPARIPSYVISGIGFLGAGTILVKGATVRGLTTAASIWVVAGLGLVVGVGMYALAILTTLVVLLSLFFLNQLERRFFQSDKVLTLTIIVNKDEKHLSEVIDKLEENNVSIRSFFVKKDNNKDEIEVSSFKKYIIEVKLPNKKIKARLLEDIHDISGIKEIK